MNTKRSSGLRRSLLAASISSVLVGGGVLSPVAFAQETPEGAEPREVVVITGTRISAREGYDAPTPTTVVNDEFMESLGISNISDMVVQIPSNQSFFQPENTGGSPFFVGSTLANLRGLNPYFGTRTLTLVDSKRHVPTNNGSSVDLNAIPSLLVDRMEVVTGGASAAYGSDAISGVVNILLDKDLEGMKAEFDYGTYSGEGNNYRVGLAGGMELLDGRGHLVIGGEFAEQETYANCVDRDWCAEGWELYSNGGVFQPAGTPYFPVVPGMPQTFFRTGRTLNQSSYSGVIYNAGLEFNDAGSDTQPFVIGALGNSSPFSSSSGGDGRPAYENTTLMPETERSNLLASLSYDFTDTLGGFIDVSWANVKGLNSQDDAYFYGVENYCIAPDNAYIQGNAALQNAIAASVGNGTFFFCPGQTLVRKDFTDDINRRADVDSNTWRVIAGLDGQIGDSTWNWEGSFQLGQTKRDQIGYEYPSVYRYQMAIDAVLDGSGNPVCRVTRDGAAALPPFADPSLANGCVPINIIGNTPLTRQQIDYAWGPIVEYNTIDQEIVAGSVSGELWQGFGAGPLLGAFGVELRNEELQNDVNEEIPAAQRIDIAAQYGDAFGGKVDVTETFIELEMPFVSGKPGAELLSINAAYRDATYETTDTDRGQGTSEQDIESWKVALIYDPLDWLRFRGSKSRDVRAAGFRELYWQLTQPAAASGFGVQLNPWKPDLGFFGSQNDPTTLIITGDVSLRPEKADTTTYGFVFTPSGGTFEGFRFSMDYWEITITDGIQGGGMAQRTIQNCYINNELCDLITFVDNDPLSATYRQDMIDVRAPAYNARRYDASGIDFSVDYSMNVGSGMLAFRLLTSRALETIVRTPPTIPGGAETVRDISGQVGAPVGFFADWAGSPNFSHNLVVTYAQGPFSITTQGMFISEGRMDLETPKLGPSDPGYNVNLVGSTDYPIIDEHLTWNMTGTYRLETDRLEGTELFLTIENIADKDPKFSTSGIAVGGAYPVLYPSLGRTYRLGARMSF